MSHKLIVVIESPYAGAVATNVDYARACLKDSLARGEAPYASHLLYTQRGVLDDTIPAERAQGIAAGLAFHAVADLVAFYLDLGWSAGMQAAYQDALMHGRKIELRRLDDTLDEVG